MNRQPAAIHNTPAGSLLHAFGQHDSCSIPVGSNSMEGDSLAAVETRRARDLLQTAMVQQQSYSYSRDRIHSTPCPSKSYSRHIDEPEVSSSARRRNAPQGPNLARGEVNAQDVVDNGRV